AVVQAELERQLAALERLCADQRINRRGQNFFRSIVRNFLDFDAAFGGRHEHDATGGAIDDRTQIQLIGDISAGLDEDLGNRLAVGVCLIGHQDRKSTRLNSSHVKISYAVFCLKKKI